MMKEEVTFLLDRAFLTLSFPPPSPPKIYLNASRGVHQNDSV